MLFASSEPSLAFADRVMQTTKFIPLSRVLAERTPADWAFIFGNDHDFLRYCTSLQNYIKVRNPKRVIVLVSDRAVFLACTLVAFQLGVQVVLPHFKTPGVLADICSADDLVLDDDIDLSLDQEACFFHPIINATLTLYTSGSTGQPKEIQKSIHQLQAEISVLHNLWGQNLSPKIWATVSHHHIYGLLFSLLWPVCAGYQIESQTVNFWEEIEDRVSVTDYIVSSPAHLSRLGAVESLLCARVFSSGSPLGFEAAETSAKVFGHLPYEILGSTETGGIAYRQQAQPNQYWQVFSGVDASVNVTGNLVLRSPYLPTEDAYESADRINLHAPGQFTLLGRSDKVVKIEGKRVDLLDLEKRLSDLIPIDQALTVVFDEGRSEIGVVAILSDLGRHQLNELGTEKFSRLLRNDLSIHFERVLLPRRWRFVDEFPRDSQGKRPTYLLKSLFEGVVRE